jgi:hypothetical protein
MALLTTTAIACGGAFMNRERNDLIVYCVTPSNSLIIAEFQELT